MGKYALIGIATGVSVACMWGLWHTMGAVFYWFYMHNTVWSSNWDWLEIGFFGFCSLLLLVIGSICLMPIASLIVDKVLGDKG